MSTYKEFHEELVLRTAKIIGMAVALDNPDMMKECVALQNVIMANQKRRTIYTPKQKAEIVKRAKNLMVMGTSQNDAARELGVVPVTLQSWMNGEKL